MRFAPPHWREVALVIGGLFLWLSPFAHSQVIVNGGQLIIRGRPDFLGVTGADGFTVKKVSSDVAIAMEEFEEYCKKQEWEKAFGTLPTLVDAKSMGLVDVGNGLYMPIRARFRQVLVGLSPSGREAYRVFNDAPAKQGLAGVTASEDPDAPVVTNEVAQLQDLFDKYFITAAGDRIGDRLGDTKFEAGDFSAAAECWDAVLRDFPDSSLSAMRLNVKRAIALARARRWNDFVQASLFISEKYGDERIRLGTDDISVKTLMEDLAAPIPAASASRPEPAAAGPIRLPQSEEPLWQCVFADDTYLAEVDRLFKNTGMAGSVLSPSMIAPRAVADDKRIYLNWFGTFMAIDAQTGKLLHRSRQSFTGMASSVQQSVQLGFDGSSDQSIVMLPGRDRVVATNPLPGIGVTRIVRIQGADGSWIQSGASQMTCYSTTGFTSWWTSDQSGLATWTILGAPLLDGETMYLTARSNVTIAGTTTSPMDMHLVAVDCNNGRLLWSLPLGTMSSATITRGVGTLPKPLLSKWGDRMYVQTGDKAVVAVNLVRRNVEWAYTWGKTAAAGNAVPGAPVTPPGYVYRQQDPLQWPPSVAVSEAGLFVKDRSSGTLYAIDPGKPALMWTHPVEVSASIIGADDGSIYLLGRQLDCIDLRKREMRWSAKLPGLNGSIEPLKIGTHLYVFSARGMYDVDLASGDVKQFQGYDRDGFGGTVVRCGDRLICISNRAVTAYAMPGQ